MILLAGSWDPSSRIVDIRPSLFARAEVSSTGESALCRREESKLPGCLLLLLLQCLKSLWNSLILLHNWLCLLSLPTTGRIACPATKGAANKTAPPPMIPKLLTAAKWQYLQDQNMMIYYLQGNHSCRWKMEEDEESQGNFWYWSDQAV